MATTYDSLNSLVADSSEANQYFNNLPDYVREQISSRGDNVNSLASLKDYAENLLRGDD